MTAITHPGERGSMTELAMVRLADEGVPIKALVRVFRRPFDEVERLLKEAKDDGRIIDLPAPDWPSGARRDERVPTVVVARGRPSLDFILAVRRTFSLSATPATMLAELIWRGRASKAHLHEVIESEAEPKIIDIFICKIRGKLAPFQLGIETVWGWGYALEDDVRAAMVRRIRETCDCNTDVFAIRDADEVVA